METEDRKPGIRYCGTLDISGRFVTSDEPGPAAFCPAEPCSWCGACAVCGDFHFYEPGHGCTAETCPMKKST
jgi:hypothetical protein